VNESAGARPIDPALLELGRQVHARYTLAARIARATWPVEETSPEAMVAATATVFIELSRALSSGPRNNGVASPPADMPPACPVCGGVMRDQRATKRGNQPDWKCSQGACDGAVWLDRKKTGTPRHRQ
jgi:hypothetical protein